MINQKMVGLLAALAVVASLIAISIFVILALQSGVVNWTAVAGCLVVALGAGARLRKSSPAGSAAAH